MNKFRPEQEVEPAVFQVNPKVGEEQNGRLRRFKKERDPNHLRSVLQRVREATTGNENLMPILLQAVKTHATVEEICDIFREIYGAYEEVKPF